MVPIKALGGSTLNVVMSILCFPTKIIFLPEIAAVKIIFTRFVTPAIVKSPKVSMV
jgi:hypothetical protein